MTLISLLWQTQVADTTETITSAAEFGITQSGPTMAPVVFLSDIHSRDPDVAQGLH